MHNPVILSGAKDPLPAGITTSSARSFCYPLEVETGGWLLGTCN